MTKRTVSTRSLPRQAEAAPRTAAARSAAPAPRLAVIGRSSHRHQPNFRRNSMMRRRQAGVKPGSRKAAATRARDRRRGSDRAARSARMARDRQAVARWPATTARSSRRRRGRRSRRRGCGRGRGDDLDHAGRHPLGLGAVVLDEGDSGGRGRRACGARASASLEADAGERRIGEGHRGDSGGIARGPAGGRGSQRSTRRPDSSARLRQRRAGDRRRRSHRRGGWWCADSRSTTMPSRRGRCRRRRGRAPRCSAPGRVATRRCEPSTATLLVASRRA